MKPVSESSPPDPSHPQEWDALEIWAGDRAKTIFQWALDEAADPDLAITSLIRWAQASSNAETQLAALLDTPRLGQWVMVLLGSGLQMADHLVQNPEFASWIVDPSVLAREPLREDILREGEQMLRVASGYNHKLDRLRYLKQEWTLRILLNDISGSWPQPQVWKAISTLAEALTELALQTVITEYAGLRGLNEPCSIGIIAFGKLGGEELNYSSDIDLVLVRSDEPSVWDERHTARLAEMLNRALSEAMGRGFMYRVDFRLRPYGSAGPMVPTMRATEAYYRSHAEEWEFQALLRSRWIAGDPSFQSKWEQLRSTYCFRPQLSESAIDSILHMRKQIEGHHPEADLKCGPGGIRDVEFIAQLLQRAYGGHHPEVRVRPTLSALEALSTAGVLDGTAALELASDYTFLRLLEHRLQIGGRQTHVFPALHAEQVKLARLMRFANASDLTKEVSEVRNRIRARYQELAQPWAPKTSRDEVLSVASDCQPMLANWIDGLPDSERFYQSLLENEASLERARHLIHGAPRLFEVINAQVGLSEAVLSGEIEEPMEASELNRSVASQHDLPRLVATVQFQWLRIWWRFSIGEITVAQASEEACALADRSLRWFCHHIGATFNVISLGSFGLHTLGPASDLDVIILCDQSESQSSHERHAQALLDCVATSRQMGMPIAVDIRLRPEGANGLLVRTFDAIRLYEITSMEMWERFALGTCRLVLGGQSAIDLILWAAYNQPLTPERLDELLKMKFRIESERVQAKHALRHVKLGVGGLTDIEWFVRLHEMRYPTATGAQTSRPLRDRIFALSRARLVHAVELEELSEALEYLMALRIHLWLLNNSNDVIPENPDKLDMLGHLLGFHDGNAFLAHHESIIRRVRQIFNEGIERLRR